MHDRYAGGAGNPATTYGTADRGRARLGTKLRETTKSQREVAAASVPSPPRFTINVLAKWAEDSLIDDGWIQERPCRLTSDTGASVTITGPDVAGLSERKMSLPYILQTVSGETIPVMKEVCVKLTVGRRPLSI
jgi:hypothetical protein